MRAICRLHANFVDLDREREIYSGAHRFGVGGVTSPDLHSDMRSDVGGSLFVNVQRFGDLLDRYLHALGGPSSPHLLDRARNGIAFKEVVETEDAWKATCDWQEDVVHFWA